MGSVSLINGHIDDDEVTEMTYEQAKAWFEEDLKDGKCSDDCPSCNAMTLAIKAIGTRIPKKIVAKILTIYGERGYCPRCGRILLACQGFKACPDCGQALDWSDAE